MQVIENTKNNQARQLLTGLGIPNVGKAAAKELMKNFASIEELADTTVERLVEIDDVGEITARGIVDYFHNESNREVLNKLIQSGVNTRAEEKKDTSDLKLTGLTFVITGTLPSMGRKEAAILIEENGGKVSSSVSKKTNYLLAGEAAGSKLTKANELGVNIISQDELIRMING